MNKETPPVKESTGNGKSAGPYDVVMLIAKSFGPMLPMVVVVILIACGAYYAIHEMSNLQGQVQKAEFQKLQAETEAKSAADRARLDAMQESSKQLIHSNEASSEISKRIEGLVSGQMDIMEKNERLSSGLADKLAEYQKEKGKVEVDRLKDQLNSLNVQIADAKKQMEEQTRASALSNYNEIRDQIASTVRSENVPSYDMITFLGQRLANSDVESQAVKDLKDDRNDWVLRLIIGLELFKKTSKQEYVSAAHSLILENSNVVDGSGSKGSKQSRELTVVSLLCDRALTEPTSNLVLDGRYPLRFRMNLLRASSPITNMVAAKASKGGADELVKAIGSELVSEATNGHSDYYDVWFTLGLLGQLSQEAQLVYASRSLGLAKGYSEDATQRIKEELEKVVGDKQPTPESRQRWGY